MKARSIRIAMLLLLTLGASTAVADLQVSEQAVSFNVVATGGYRFCHAIIELPDHGNGEWKTVDLLVETGCPEAMGQLALGLVSLWAHPPQDWTEALDPEHTRMGLFFQTDEEGIHKAEIASSFLAAGADAGQSLALVLAFECGDVDCGCSSLLEGATLRFTSVETDEP